MLARYAGLAAVTVIHAHTVIHLLHVRQLVSHAGVVLLRTLEIDPKTQG